MEGGIDNYLGDDNDTTKDGTDTELTEGQVKCNQIFDTYDTDGNQLIDWSEWQNYLRVHEPSYDSGKEDNVDFWMTQKMHYNFMDLNGDDLINKEECVYFLDHPVQ